ncbi:hypothetical protein [Tateyamaria sp.]|uniref:hypothetical protein n=1 Tax=Tateyamaria sp. TaxID=1929288 RepID=UPI00329AB946
MKRFTLASATLALLVTTATAQELQLPTSVPDMSGSQTSGIIMPLPNLGSGSFAGGITHNGATTIVQHQNFGGGHTNTGATYNSGTGYGGNVSVQTGPSGVNGGFVGVTIPFN